MYTVRHGLSVGMERCNGSFLLSLKVIGKLTHEDYEIVVPMLENSISGISHPDIHVLVDATELEGWEMRAAWDDLKLGLKHGREFSRVAIVGNKTWEKVASKIGGWFIAGEMRLFEDVPSALDWLNA